MLWEGHIKYLRGVCGVLRGVLNPTRGARSQKKANDYV